MHTGRNPQFTCYDYTSIVSAMYFQESTLHYVFWKNMVSTKKPDGKTRLLL